MRRPDGSLRIPCTLELIGTIKKGRDPYLYLVG
jgi:hypothetical protein